MTASVRLTLFLIVVFTGGFLSEIRAQDQPPKNVVAGRQTAERAQDVYAADLDGDGDKDILSTSSLDDKIAWHENTDGEASFSNQKVITTDAHGAESVHAADLDEDSDLDVVSASVDDDKIAWYENTDGQGTFSDPKVITTDADNASSVYATDLNGDGDTDVLSASAVDNEIAWYRNTNSQGAFSEPKIITTNANNALSVYAADLTGDGNPDVLSASFEDDKIAWYKNTGDGFSDQKVISTNAKEAQRVYAADLTGDGNRDVLSASQGDGKIAWYKNTDGLGSFSDQKVITTDAVSATSVYAADLDEDGDQDVLSSSRFDDRVAVYENEEGTFGDPLIISTDANGAQSVHAADLDEDGDTDILSASQIDDKIAWYSNHIDEGQGFGSQRIIVPRKLVVGPVSVHAADLDGDADLDVLSASEGDFDTESEIAWYENIDGQGTFSDPKVVTTDAAGAQFVYAADLTGDGNQDVLSAHANEIAWYENTDGQGSFSDQQVITTDAARAQSVFAADLDGDGDTDALSASADDGKVAWYENTGGSFSAQKVITTNTRKARSVYAADVDGDGDQDVLSASQIDDKIAWYENTDGQGSFSDQQVITTDAAGAQSVLAADVNGDDIQDVLSASLGGEIAWYENTGGSFSDTKVISTEANDARSIFVADLDNDEDLDVLSAHDKGITWYEQSTSFGSISFSQAKDIDSPVGQAIRAADLDSDGDPDPLAALGARNSNDQITWYENTSSALPVELTNIEATQTDAGVVLTWHTASEQNNTGFEVQRKASTRFSGTWQRIGFVEGSGTTQQAHSYRFEDSDLPFAVDTLHYRLRQIDNDGTSSLLPVIAVSLALPETLTLRAPYPNPTSERATVLLAIPNITENSQATLRIYDVLGRQVRTTRLGKTGRQSVTLKTSGLSPGTYFLRLRMGDQTATRQITVVR